MYTLFVDESSVSDGKEDYFVVGGVIIDKQSINSVSSQLTTLKHRIWAGDVNAANYILHELDMWKIHKNPHSIHNTTIPRYNSIFSSNRKVLELYAGLSIIFRSCNLKTIGVCYRAHKLSHEFGNKSLLNNPYRTSIQMLVEHYCQFLIFHNSTGNICYESIDESTNRIMKQRIYELLALGTMHYSPDTLQSHISGIEFVQKSSNNPGLQLSDFVPNTLARYSATLSAKNRDFSRNVRRLLYDGTIHGGKAQFGYKVLGDFDKEC